MRRLSAGPALWVIAQVTLAGLVGLTPVAGQIQVQNSAALSMRISELRKEIETGEAAHASAERLGTLWLALANVYRSQLDLQSAEDAFAHAVRCLHGTRELYASALDGIATVYLAIGRMGRAERCLRRALDLERTPGGSPAEATIRKDLAAALITEHRYAEALMQVSEALHHLEAQANPDITETMVVYMTRSRALCGMRRCGEALQDLDRVLALTEGKIAADSLDMIAITAIRGMEQIRSGAVEEGDRAIQQALRLTNSRTDLPDSLQTGMRFRILDGYSESLGFAHRKRERKKVEEELARIKAQPPRGCNGCTVSTARLGLALP